MVYIRDLSADCCAAAYRPSSIVSNLCHALIWSERYPSKIYANLFDTFRSDDSRNDAVSLALTPAQHQLVDSIFHALLTARYPWGQIAAKLFVSNSFSFIRVWV
jgi:hypothetical protein